MVLPPAADRNGRLFPFPVGAGTARRSILLSDFYASVPADEGSSCAGGSSESVSDGAEEFEE